MLNGINTPESDYFGMEAAWANSLKEYPVGTSGESSAVIEKLYKKYHNEIRNCYK